MDLRFSAEERALFFASTSIHWSSTLLTIDQWIGGRSVSEIVSQLSNCIAKRRWKLRTGLQANSWTHNIHGHTTLTMEPDHLLWKWTSSGVYSAKSCYQATFQGSLRSSSWKFIWRNWAPPRVCFFHWLADQDWCWTADCLARRGLKHRTSCLLCC